MKKFTCILSIVLVIGLTLPGQPLPPKAKKAEITSRFSAAIGAGVRNFSGDEYDVMPAINLSFNLDISYRAFRSLAFFLHTDFLSAKGETSVTEEETTLTVVPIEGGIRWLLGKSPAVWYLGAGAGLYLISEEAPVGTTDVSGVGFFAEGGLRYMFGSSFFGGLRIKYVSVSVRPDSESIQLGGPSVMVEIGLNF